ncbi:bifunctional succinyldiaminopimelate transaminase/glutamate-prephenate aminotransferase [Streptomyces sp. NPDC058293]|uniref:Bifunctional succinyldiaminopimelate transaminase/glutamate-prephenate aminotransferase n=1 Tax=Streptomyces sp. NBC_00119 TaxID=2975659 RepID=A0AAU1U767_9ACTN|nr:MULTISPECIES: bifunctional succinyldiaminopimelate transaminase/glutamate-prephenate aminotransferase [unclassified Streptomyces]MCX4643386.1 bifunctional succinyldiaminopimelate transaminase/glutamate-prephenate aminotransferase [Streptomyces sp. NBC_01446]MCX5324509.1 bifunctional succinyldiaminopimelate transaminase/glutamate-prephenate aminotransferase [Streptomyces sp. NBC_00120]
MSAVSDRLPTFPWDKLEPYKKTAAAHEGGIVDLSVGTPVDPVPELIQKALIAAADSPGYPTVWGTPELRDALVGWSERRLGARGFTHHNVLPIVGSKELVAWLPTQLGLGPGDKVAYPRLAYPTYEVGARLARADHVAYDAEAFAADAEGTALDPTGIKLLWLNSPSNPTGRVLSKDELTRIVAWAREHGILVFSDECYIELGWEADPVSVLHPDVCGGSYEGIVSVHSLSKRSNLAGYRAAFLAGDAAVLGDLLQIRKHGGMMTSAPTQAAVVAALGDDDHVQEQRGRYAARRAALRDALVQHGFRIEHSEASLYLWATRHESCWDTVAHLAELGILVAPGDFYGPAGDRFVRVALTASDERVAAAVERLSQGA